MSFKKNKKQNILCLYYKRETFRHVWQPGPSQQWVVASFLPLLAIGFPLGLTSWPHPPALVCFSHALMARTKNMHFSFWDHEILTHLCNVLFTHADVSVLTGQKGLRWVGGSRVSGADVTLSQSVTSWFIYRCMNMWKHLEKLNLCERGSRPSKRETTTSLKMKPTPALTPLTHRWRAWTSHIRVKCWCSSSGRWDGSTLAR